MTYIYTLEDQNGDIRYVGQTIRVKNRLSEHCNSSKLKKKTHKNNWIKSILLMGFKPIFNIIEEVEDIDANWSEIYWISQFKSWGFNLTNGTDGGAYDNANRKGAKLTEEHKLKLSKSTKGKKKSNEFIEKITGEKNHFYGKKHSEETRKKLSEIAKARMTDERKKQISESVKKAMANPKLQKHISEQLKIAMAGEGNPMYGKIGENNPNYGRKNTEKTKKKMSLAAKKRWSKNK